MATSSLQIREALQILEKENDDHWTADGLPRMDVLEDLLNDESIVRANVTDAAPKFNREDMDLEVVEPEAGEKKSFLGSVADKFTGNKDLDENETEEDLDGETEIEEEEEVEETEAETETEIEEDPDGEESDDGEVEEEIDLELEELAEEAATKIEEEFEAAAKELVKANEVLAAANKRSIKAQEGMDRVILAREAVKGKRNNQQDIVDYLKSQNKIRLEKAKNRGNLKKALGGVDMSAFETSAPIDKAMARKNTRGTARPSRPLAKDE